MPHTLEVVKPLTIEILRSDPERVVDRCQYWNDYEDCPDCVIGHVLASLGHDVPALVSDYGSNRCRIGTVPCIRELFEPEALDFLKDVQHSQDQKIPWGQIVSDIENGSLEPFTEPLRL